MSVPNQTPYIIYNANGLTTVFPFEFYIINSGDIQVTINGTVITSGYTVSGVGNIVGGDVIFITPPASGSVVMLERVVPTYRLTDYQDNGDLLADTVNKDFDRLWMAIQRYGIHLGLALRRPLFGGPFDAEGYRIEKLADPVNAQDAVTKKYLESVSLARVLRVPEASVGLVPSLEMRRNKLLAFNDSGDPIPVVPESGSAADVLIELAKPTGSSLSGYQYPADGSVPRTVEDKLSDFVNVLDFGKEVGTGGDDTAAFQKAINTGKTVFVPPGTYRMQKVQTNKLLLVANVPGTVEIHPLAPASIDNSACIYVRGASKENMSEQNLVKNITFSSPYAGEGEAPYLLFCEFIQFSTFENLLFYRGTFELYNHKYCNVYGCRLYGARLFADQNKSAVNFEAAVGLHIDRLYGAFTSSVEIRNSTDNRITNSYITNPGMGLLIEFDDDFFNAGLGKPFCGVLKMSNVIIEARTVIRHIALSNFINSWFGAFSGSGLRLQYCYGISITGSSSHYCVGGSGMELDNVFDSSFASSSFTNATNDGVTMDNCSNIQFVANSFGTFEVYE